MASLTTKQLEQNAEAFVNEYKNAPDDEISRIVAGMTAIIEGNESSYERMKDQKWFERIWYGLTLKNKATVKEMQAKREELTKYTVQILVKLNNLITEHSECVLDLYRAIAVARRDLDVVVDEVNLLAHKLNEKIESLENYEDLKDDIRDGVFDKNTPLISLLDIMSRLDGRTAKDANRMQRLRKEMEKAGFDFSKKVDISSFSEEVLSLPQDKVGRILLFCQSFSRNSKFLAYTCSLMENYFYLWETDKRYARENGEAVESALYYSQLTRDASCIVNEMYDDLLREVPRSFEVLEIMNNTPAPVTPAEYYDNKTATSINVIVTGITGSGKSTLINAVLGDSGKATTGRGGSVTLQTSKYSNGSNMCFYDTRGFGLDSNNNANIIADIKAIIKNNQPYVIWYCINSLTNKYEETIPQELHSIGLPMVIVLTQSIEVDDDFARDIVKINCGNTLRNVPVISVLAKEYVLRRENISIHAFGLEELIDKTIDALS